jgi:quercetin dioxygenase-like cupin family protein
MTTRMREEIRVGPMAIRFLIEGEESGGSVAMFEFDVPAGTTVAAGHSHDGYEETIYGARGSADLDDRGRGDRHRPR